MGEDMKICYLHIDYEEWTNGHYNVQEIGLAKAFEELGHDVTIIYWVKASDRKCGTEVAISEHIRKTYLPGKNIKHHIVFDCNLLKKYNFDLIHVQSDNLFYVPEVTKWCRKNRIPYYCYVGTIESSNPDRIQRKIIDFISKRNLKAFSKSKVFVKTPAMKKKLESLGIKDVEVAAVGLDFSIIPDITDSSTELRKKLNLSQDKKIVLCVCALRESKHPLDIFEIACNLDNNYQIVFIGNGDLSEEMDKEIAKKEFACDFIHIPFIENSAIHEYYKCADFFVNLNPDEIFGMAILEAMYQECTVIARHAPGPDFIIEDRKCGYLANTPEEIAALVRTVPPIGTVDRKRVIESFSWNTMATTVLGWYKELFDLRRG